MKGILYITAGALIIALCIIHVIMVEGNVNLVHSAIYVLLGILSGYLIGTGYNKLKE